MRVQVLPFCSLRSALVVPALADTTFAATLAGHALIPAASIIAPPAGDADDTRIMVAVDNNLPYSSGRALDKAADNASVLLSVPELLAAK